MLFLNRTLFVDDLGLRRWLEEGLGALEYFYSYILNDRTLKVCVPAVLKTDNLWKSRGGPNSAKFSL